MNLEGSKPWKVKRLMQMCSTGIQKGSYLEKWISGYDTDQEEECVVDQAIELMG